MPAALEWRRTGPPKLPIRGDELAREAGIEPGPELGRVIEELREAAYAGEIEAKGDAIELARRLRHNPVS
jgi:poly(A) polymerase